MSLLEVLVSAFIMSLLTTMAITVVLAITRYFHRALTSYYLHQDAITALSSLSRELSASNLGAIDAPATGGVVVAVPGLDETQSPPVLHWVGWACYCEMPVKGEPALVRMEQPITPPSAAPPTPLTVTQFQTSGQRSKLLAPHLKSFTVSLIGGLHPGATVTLELAVDSPKRYSVKVTSKVAIRN